MIHINVFLLFFNLSEGNPSSSTQKGSGSDITQTAQMFYVDAVNILDIILGNENWGISENLTNQSDTTLIYLFPNVPKTLSDLDLRGTEANKRLWALQNFDESKKSCQLVIELQQENDLYKMLLESSLAAADYSSDEAHQHYGFVAQWFHGNKE